MRNVNTKHRFGVPLSIVLITHCVLSFCFLLEHRTWKHQSLTSESIRILSFHFLPINEKCKHKCSFKHPFVPFFLYSIWRNRIHTSQHPCLYTLQPSLSSLLFFFPLFIYIYCYMTMFSSLLVAGTITFAMVSSTDYINSLHPI